MNLCYEITTYIFKLEVINLDFLSLVSMKIIKISEKNLSDTKNFKIYMYLPRYLKARISIGKWMLLLVEPELAAVI